MTKDILIQKAYCGIWDKFKHSIDENGWLWSQGFTKFEKLFKFDENLFEIKGFNKTLRFRPNILRGIDDNNGWVKIENDTNLPPTTGDYIVIIDGNIAKLNYYYSGGNRWISPHNPYTKTSQTMGITHYRPWEEFSLPLF